jgi:hypothetical protein
LNASHGKYTYSIWENIPCRIRNYGNYLTMEVEMYKKGEGYVPGHVGRIYDEGFLVSEKHYKEYFIKYTKNSK